jgi:amino acid transporter
MDNHLEQVPMGATLLHWIFEVLLVVIVGVSVKPSTAYRMLTFLMTFAVFILFGLLTVLGLAYLKIDSWARGENGRRWSSKVAWRPWLDPLPTFVACAALLFLTFAMFVPPSEEPKMFVEHWIPRIIGWGVFFSGGLWWLGMRFVQWKGRWKLVRRRVPYIEIDHQGEPIMKAEFVEHERVPVRGNMRKRHASVATT